MNEDRRRILWTGGFDSSYLVLDALDRGYAVDAYVWRGYGMPQKWQKVRNEDEARRRIAHGLPTDLRARLTEHVERDYVRAYPLVHAAWDELHSEHPGYSPQLQVILPLPKLTGGPLELAYVADDTPTERTLGLLHREGLLTPLVERSKADLLADARARGFAHLLDLTWSCEGNEPFCGTCDPCRQRIIPAHSFERRIIVPKPKERAA